MEPARHAALQQSHRSPQVTRPEAASTSSPSGVPPTPRRQGWGQESLSLPSAVTLVSHPSWLAFLSLFRKHNHGAATWL